MHLLFRNCTIIDPHGPHHEQTLDLRIADGRLVELGKALEAADATVHTAQDLHVSIGWIDLEAEGGEPGYEQREDLSSLLRAARIGGYTRIGLRPNASPPIHDKAGIGNLLRQSEGHGVQLLPIGAITHDLNGRDLTEMMDMQHAGAVAFSDGAQPIAHGGVFLRALQYVQAFDGLILHQPLDQSVAGQGQLHEGVLSTRLGLPGIPALAEELMVARDLQLLAYTGSRLHLSHLSTAGAVAQVRKAKAAGLRVTASVAALNLYATDEALTGFSVNHKVLPPLRCEADRQALIGGLVDGTIDLVSSNHTPREQEAKKVEFLYADFGAAMLSTAYGAFNYALHDQLSTSEIIAKLTQAPRRVLGLTQATITKGMEAELTFFQPRTDWIPTLADIASKSKNAPLVGAPLRGRVLGTVLGKDAWFSA
ncbi:MAG: dihydroorotase [Bacteroidetes bacterium]|nr:MAG: dihydroorotase [Bacteroidota bacterium]